MGKPLEPTRMQNLQYPAGRDLLSLSTARLLIILVLLIIGSRLNAAAPAAGSPQNISRPELQQFLDNENGGTLVGKVFPGYWFIGANFRAHDNPKRQFKFVSCRLTGWGVQINEPNSINLTLQDCVIEGDVVFYVGGEGISVDMTDVEIGGDVFVSVDAHDQKRSSEVRFSHARIGGGLIFDSGSGSQFRFVLTATRIADDAMFRGFPNIAGDITLLDVRVGGDLVLLGQGDSAAAPAGVHLASVTIAGRAAFEDCVLRVLDLNGTGYPPGDTMQLTRSCSVGGRTSFSRCQIDQVNLRRTTFRKDVRFDSCRVNDIRLDDARFEDDLVFQLTEIRDHLSCNGVRLEKKLDLEWSRIVLTGPWIRSWMNPPTRVTDWAVETGYASDAWQHSVPKEPTATVWRNLHNAWRGSGDNQAANEADYHRAYLEQGIGTSLFVWGFGYRPGRALSWLSVEVLLFAALFWTQVPEVVRGIARLRSAVTFSVRTAWEWKFGWDHTRGPYWRTTALAEQAITKVLILLFLKALANTSPLLKEIMDKLLPFS